MQLQALVLGVLQKGSAESDVLAEKLLCTPLKPVVAESHFSRTEPAKINFQPSL